MVIIVRFCFAVNGIDIEMAYFYPVMLANMPLYNLVSLSANGGLLLDHK